MTKIYIFFNSQELPFTDLVSASQRCESRNGFMFESVNVTGKQSVSLCY